ncbi:ZPR1 zinc finger domain-containing protein [Candidatus Woesearchaeota archaeon]|nr:ZPR1 zinc finger domain-containing protein [Candidatus Woesearchaeota archaeon]
MPAKKSEEANTLGGQPCPVCGKSTLTLSEAESEVPYFGKLFIFGMNCSGCGFHKADVEAAEQKEPVKWTLEVSSKEDLSIRVIKSSEATVRIPYIGDITPGPASEGYVTNVEGILNRIKEQVEHLRDSAEEDEDRQKAKNILKKIMRVIWGDERIKLIIEDPTGNSAIISDKAQKAKP